MGLDYQPVRFNQKITPHRWYAYAKLSVSDMKRVKEKLGGTLNDVFIAVCSGALRRYLTGHGEGHNNTAATTTSPGMNSPVPPAEASADRKSSKKSKKKKKR